MKLFTVIVTGIAAALAVRSALPGLRSRRRREGSIDIARLPSIWFRLAFPVTRRLAPSMARIGWTSYRRTAAVALQRAGFDALPLDYLLAMKVFTAVSLPAFFALILPVLRNPAVFLAAAVAGFYVPDYLIAEARKRRDQDLVRALPGAVDVLSLSVEAGLDFAAALQRYAERAAPGPLRDQMATVLNDIRLGTPRAQALKNMAATVPIPEVTSFVSVLVQADTLGASIGPVLMTQGERMRVERFQRAEKEGAKATQKILFPLVFFIFPAVLIVIVGPVALQYLANR